MAAAKPLFTPGSAHAQQDLSSMFVNGNMALLVSNFPGNMQQRNTSGHVVMHTASIWLLLVQQKAQGRHARKLMA